MLIALAFGASAATSRPYTVPQHPGIRVFTYALSMRPAQQLEPQHERKRGADQELSPWPGMHPVFAEPLERPIAPRDT